MNKKKLESQMVNCVNPTVAEELSASLDELSDENLQYIVGGRYALDGCTTTTTTSSDGVTVTTTTCT